MVFISLREYETSSAISLTVGQRDALRKLVPDLRIEAAPGELSAYLLTPGSRVGAVALENLAIEIAPKLSIQRVLFLVSYSLGLAKWGDRPFEMTMGVCDGAEGVQWNTWLHRAENAAYVAVNLEGLKYDGWPIARFIEREFRHTRLFEVARQLAAPESIQMIFHRDAWRFASRPAIEERHIGLSGRALTEIDPEGWKRTLQEAYDCLDAERGHRHRGRQMVTTKSGRVELSVSPHLQFRQRISDAAEAQREWTSRLRGAQEALQPLYAFVKEQAIA